MSLPENQDGGQIIFFIINRRYNNIFKEVHPMKFQSILLGFEINMTFKAR